MTGGIGGGGGATVVASFVPLLLDGKLLFSGGNIVVIVVPSPQILPPGARVIVESHLAAIDGHQRRCSSATAMITLTPTIPTPKPADPDDVDGESSPATDPLPHPCDTSDPVARAGL